MQTKREAKTRARKNKLSTASSSELPVTDQKNLTIELKNTSSNLSIAPVIDEKSLTIELKDTSSSMRIWQTKTSIHQTNIVPFLFPNHKLGLFTPRHTISFKLDSKKVETDFTELDILDTEKNKITRKDLPIHTPMLYVTKAGSILLSDEKKSSICDSASDTVKKPFTTFNSLYLHAISENETAYVISTKQTDIDSKNISPNCTIEIHDTKKLETGLTSLSYSIKAPLNYAFINSILALENCLAIATTTGYLIFMRKDEKGQYTDKKYSHIKMNKFKLHINNPFLIKLSKNKLACSYHINAMIKDVSGTCVQVLDTTELDNKELGEIEWESGISIPSAQNNPHKPLLQLDENTLCFASKAEIHLIDMSDAKLKVKSITLAYTMTIENLALSSDKKELYITYIKNADDKFYVLQLNPKELHHKNRDCQRLFSHAEEKSVKISTEETSNQAQCCIMM